MVSAVARVQSSASLHAVLLTVVHSNKHAGVASASNCKCKQALYCSTDCKRADAELHQLLCKQADGLSTANAQDESRIQVIILHAKTVQAEFVMATVTDAGLALNHPALNTFKLSQPDLVPVPDLVNYQLRNFRLTRWLGHVVLFWTLVNWAELPMEWVNRTAIFMGGPAGHSNLFYGPLVVSIVAQDMAHLHQRTLAHAQMRTLRQVADYIQMVEDNPCVANPHRFESVPARLHPEPDLVAIPAVKVNDKVELALMAPFGMTATMEEVFVAISSRTQEQCAAVVPFALGLKWYARSAKLDVLVEKHCQVADRVDENLAWFQWEVVSNPGANKSGQHKASATYAHHDRSLVIVQAGGAPIRIEHIEALTVYLGLQQATSGQRAAISKEGFQNYWKENYAATREAPPSPYDLEDTYPDNLVEEDADEMMAMVCQSKDIVKEVLNIIGVRIEVLMKRLTETYAESEQVVKIIEALKLHFIGGKTLEVMLAKVVSAEVSDQDLEALRVVNALTRTHLKPELRHMAEYIARYTEKDYLSWFEKHDIK